MDSILNKGIFSFKNWRVFSGLSLILGIVAFAQTTNIYGLHPDAYMLSVFWIPPHIYYIGDWTTYILLILSTATYFFNRSYLYTLSCLYLATSAYHLASSFLDGFNPVVFHADKILLIVILQLLITSHAVVKEKDYHLYGAVQTTKPRRWVFMFLFYPVLFLIANLI